MPVNNDSGCTQFSNGAYQLPRLKTRRQGLAGLMPWGISAPKACSVACFFDCR